MMVSPGTSTCSSSSSSSSIFNQTTTLKYTIWTTKRLDSLAVDAYKSVVETIEPNYHHLLDSLSICKSKPNTLRGNTEFNDDHWKEWYVIKILLELTRIEPTMVVHIMDDFGCPLALELCDKLDLENNPDKRVYLHKGRIHLVPSTVKLDTLKSIYADINKKYFSGRDAAANFIRDVNHSKECCKELIQSTSTAISEKSTHLVEVIDDLNKIATDTDTYNIIRLNQILQQLPDAPTPIDPFVQEHILDILRGLDNLEIWSNTFAERQSQRLMAMGSGVNIQRTGLVLSDLMKVAMNEFDISPISSNGCSPGSSKHSSTISMITGSDDDEEIDSFTEENTTDGNIQPSCPGGDP